MPERKPEGSKDVSKLHNDPCSGESGKMLDLAPVANPEKIDLREYPLPIDTLVTELICIAVSLDDWVIRAFADLRAISES